MKKLIFMSFILLVTILFANNDNVIVVTKDEIDIKKKAEKVEAKIEAKDEKYNNFSLIGSYTTKRGLDGKTQVSISWEKVKNDKVEVNLNEALATNVKATAPIQKDSKLNARGNLDQLNIALNEALRKIENNEKALGNSANELQSSLDKNDDIQKETATNKSNSNDLSTNTSSGYGKNSSNDSSYTGGNFGQGSSSSNDPYTNYPNSGSTGSNGNDLDIERNAVCENKILGDNVQFVQSIAGKCMNVGSPVPVYKVTTGCTPKIDYKTNEVFVGTRKIATYENNEVVIEDCKIDYENPQELKRTFEGCSLAFRKDLKAQVQREQLYFEWDREMVKIGGCTDSSTIYPVSTYLEYNKQCRPLIDYENKTVQYAYREVAQVGERIEEISPCRYDEKLNELFVTYDGCDVVHDFNNKVSKQKERFYYLFENKKEFLGECQESKLEFPHFMTEATCEYERIGDNHVVYNKRVAYKDVNNIVNYITACKPSQDGTIQLTTEHCGYEHDFVNHQTYPKSKQFFIDPETNRKMEVSTCSRDAINFPHIQESCSYQHDDEKLFSTLWTKSYFEDTRTGEKILLAQSGANADGCIPNTKTPYVKVAEDIKLVEVLGYKDFTKSGNNWTFKHSEQTLTLDISTGREPLNKGGTFDITIRGNSTLCGYYTYFNPIVGYHSCPSNGYISNYSIPNAVCGYNPVDGNGNGGDYYLTNGTGKNCTYNNYARVGKFVKSIKYFRADGTTFELPSETMYRIID
ncbi:hypothetical protein [Aliarcobacter skirrowii]|uniref:Uncharacterized protein n=1 Tax=Aliarcobacter skirrowii TaxID=28200 RepID=A0AAW9DAV9_9BACT|nr:hypothetical protein [Aliarcobacter skirrowii]MDX4069266.1 hypothetical protein [Aliarcobacter skirrowii]